MNQYIHWIIRKLWQVHWNQFSHSYVCEANLGSQSKKQIDTNHEVSMSIDKVQGCKFHLSNLFFLIPHTDGRTISMSLPPQGKIMFTSNKNFEYIGM